MFDKPINVVLSVCLGIAMIVIVALFGINWQLNHQLDEANRTIASQSQNVGVLTSAVGVQNQAIDEYVAQIDKALITVEKEWEEAQPFIQEEERRILGIRSAPHNGNDPEQIRLKMLRDAKL